MLVAVVAIALAVLLALQGLGMLGTVTADALPAVAATVLSAALVALLVVPGASRAWSARRR
ncbi:hypothetical protein [Nonomuraea dietziae]|uniref:hypothetical protein n=1 Tax=Nonomuraea dietziae TaxID=65515 RepID=UPI0033C63EEA